jgi:hypothetical protein
MFKVNISISGNINIPTMSRLGQAINMGKLGQFALATVKSRIARGVGSDDAPMPPLKASKGREFVSRVNGRAQFRQRGYAAWKAAHGLQPIRDMRGDGSQGGHMLENLTLRSATDSRAVIAFTQTKQRQKALGNEMRTPFLSFSAEDEKRILAYAQNLFNTAIQMIGRSNGTSSQKRIAA